MCKFVHIRPKNSNGSPKTKGGFTIAFKDDGDGVYSYAIAHCHENDNFNKRMGRVKAEGRLKSLKQRFVLDRVANDDELISEVVSLHSIDIAIEMLENGPSEYDS